MGGRLGAAVHRLRCAILLADLQPLSGRGRREGWSRRAPAGRLLRQRTGFQRAIVFFAGADSVAADLVESLARPGGRLTGVLGRATDLIPKRLEILKELIPRLRSGGDLLRP